MVGMGHGVDHILDALGTNPFGKLDDLACLRRERQGIDQDPALRRNDQPGIHLQIQSRW